jgi:hypothetical protein
VRPRERADVYSPSERQSEIRFQIGDVIVERSFAGATLETVRSAFKADGRQHTAVVRRYGALRAITYDAPAWLR